MLLRTRENLFSEQQLSCKKGESVLKKYVVKSVRSVVSYTAHSSMTAGNAGWDIALTVYVCLGGGAPSH